MQAHACLNVCASVLMRERARIPAVLLSSCNWATYSSLWLSSPAHQAYAKSNSHLTATGETNPLCVSVLMLNQTTQ